MATIKKREGKKGTSYLIRSSCGYTADGRQVVASMTWKPTPGMSEKQIEKELNRQAVLFDEKCAAQGKGSGNIKFEEFGRQWFEEYAKPKMKPQTLGTMAINLDRIYAAIGHIRLDKLNARHIQKFLDNLAEEGINKREDRARAKPGIIPEGMTISALVRAAGVSHTTVDTVKRGDLISLKSAEKIAKALGKNTREIFTVYEGDKRLSPNTIRRHWADISSIMDYAFKLGLVPENPCKRVTLPVVQRVEKQIYTIEEAQRFLNSLEAAPIQYKAFFTLAIYGGFRKGEILGLEWQDIDFKNHIVKIQRASYYTEAKGIYTDTVKTEKSRRILKLPAVVFDVLRELKKHQAQEQLRLGSYWKNTGRLITAPDGGPLHPGTPYHWLQSFCKRTGQRFLGVHQFRHLNASLLINSGVDMKTVSTSLGHSNIAITMDIYSHTIAEAQAKAADAVADLLVSKMG